MTSQANQLIRVVNEGVMNECGATHNKSIKFPLPPNNNVLKDIVSTAWYSVNCIVATHNATDFSNSYTRFECRKVRLGS